MVRRFLSDLRSVAGHDLGLIRRHRRLLLSLVGVALVPSLYAITYLGSIWDPYGKTGDLPVAVVDRDTGADYHGRHVDVGGELVARLERERPFDLRRYDDADAARAAVRRGDLSFALIVPPDFSARAIAGEHTAAGQLTVYVSEGNSYMAASIARRFASELAHKGNEALNVQRWKVVFDKTGDAAESMRQLRAAVAQLRDGGHRVKDGLARASDGSTELAGGLARADQGARELSDGATRVADGTRRLTDGVARLATGIRTMNDALPPDADLDRLAAGAHAVADGARDLRDGTDELADGANRLHAGTDELRAGVAKVPLLGDKLEAGARKVEDGVGKLRDGIRHAGNGATRLAEGASRVAGGVDTLTGGVEQLGGGIRTMAGKLPADADLTRLADGSGQVATGAATLQGGLDRLSAGAGRLDDGMRQLEDGTGRLSEGLDRLNQALPASVDAPDGDAAGLGASIEPQVVITAPVANNGNGFAPYFLPLALWVGAVMTAFVFHLRRLPKPALDASRPAQVLGKLFVPAVVALSQAVIVGAVVRFALGVHARHPFEYALTLVSASLMFVTIVFWLVRTLGDAGKVVAVLFLILQISSAGGPFPIELSGSFYRTLHPYLPFTHVLEALRACLFDAYGGDWPWFYLRMLGVWALATALALAVGRWRVVPEADYEPAIEV